MIWIFFGVAQSSPGIPNSQGCPARLYSVPSSWWTTAILRHLFFFFLTSIIYLKQSNIVSSLQHSWQWVRWVYKGGGGGIHQVTRSTFLSPLQNTSRGMLAIIRTFMTHHIKSYLTGPKMKIEFKLWPFALKWYQNLDKWIFGCNATGQIWKWFHKILEKNCFEKTAFLSRLNWVQ